MITEVIFDLETQKLFSDINTTNPADLLVSVVSLYTRQLDDQLNEISGQMHSFWVDDFSSMWPYFSNVNRIIGFNSLKFDVPILAPLSPFSFTSLSHFDIMAKIQDVLGHRLSLSAIARQTLSQDKTDIGTNAVLYWQEHSPESLKKLQQYCEADVLLTRDVYDYALKNGHLKYIDKWNTPRLVDLDFSYPVPDRQSSFF
jgi:DEAD/DEAH box helicase domain-containing protein